MISVRLQGLEKVQRILDPAGVDAAIQDATKSAQSRILGIIRSAAPKGKSGQTAAKVFSIPYKTAAKNGNMSGLMIGSHARSTPANPNSRVFKDGHTASSKYPYPYPRLLEYSKKYSQKTSHLGWLKAAGKRASAALRPVLRQSLRDMKKGL